MKVTGNIRERLKSFIHDHFFVVKASYTVNPFEATEMKVDALPLKDLLLKARITAGVLLSFLPSLDPVEKWGSIALLGRIVSMEAQNDIEWARSFFRKLMWYLNDESGGIGWGIPEAMGEILYKHRKLAEEYHHILFSYVDAEGNHLENDDLVEGALWGIGRLSFGQPQLLSNCGPLKSYLDSSRLPTRIFAALSLLLTDKLRCAPSKEKLKELLEDEREILFFWNDLLTSIEAKKVIQSVLRWKGSKTKYT